MHFSAPADEPGVLYCDIKELVLSVGNYRYVVFAIDEYTRYVFIEFIKHKSDAGAAVLRIKAAFDATVATPIDADAGAAQDRAATATAATAAGGRRVPRPILGPRITGPSRRH